jgi:hypothetical protein
LVRFSVFEAERICHVAGQIVKVKVTALSYLERFFLCRSCVFVEDLAALATCAVYLAGKVEENVLSAEELVRRLGGPVTEQQVLFLEPHLLGVLGFDLIVHNPHRALFGLAADIKERLSLAHLPEGLFRAASEAVDASLRTPVSLWASPSQVALACLHLALQQQPAEHASILQTYLAVTVPAAADLAALSGLLPRLGATILRGAELSQPQPRQELEQRARQALANLKAIRPPSITDVSRFETEKVAEEAAKEAKRAAKADAARERMQREMEELTGMDASGNPISRAQGMKKDPDGEHGDEDEEEFVISKPSTAMTRKRTKGEEGEVKMKLEF